MKTLDLIGFLLLVLSFNACKPDEKETPKLNQTDPNWQFIDLGFEPSYLQSQFADHFIAGRNNQVIQSSDGAKTFKLTYQFGESLNQVLYDNTSLYIYAATNSGLYQSLNGTDFKNISPLSSDTTISVGRIFSISAVKNGDIYCGAEIKVKNNPLFTDTVAIYKSSDLGNTWKIAGSYDMGRLINVIDNDQDELLMLANNGGRLFYSSNRGQIWDLAYSQSGQIINGIALGLGNDWMFASGNGIYHSKTAKPTEWELLYSKNNNMGDPLAFLGIWTNASGIIVSNTSDGKLCYFQPSTAKWLNLETQTENQFLTISGIDLLGKAYGTYKYINSTNLTKGFCRSIKPLPL